MAKRKYESGRVNVRDADKAIFRPNSQVQDDSPEQNFNTEISREVVCYTMFGNHDYIDGDDYPILGDSTDDKGVQTDAENRTLSFARTVSTNSRNLKYYVKSAVGGKFFNPLGMDEGRHNKVLHHAIGNEFTYHQVNKSSFDYYIQFLKTKNKAHLLNAEREDS